MSSETKADIIRTLMMAGIVALEWYAMQPYKEPILAHLWNVVARVARNIARTAGWIALHAEHNYYIAAEAGL